MSSVSSPHSPILSRLGRRGGMGRGDGWHFRLYLNQVRTWNGLPEMAFHWLLKSQKPFRGSLPPDPCSDWHLRRTSRLPRRKQFVATAMDCPQLGTNRLDTDVPSRLPYEKVGDARREFLFGLLRGTKKGVVQAFFRPLKGTKTGSIRDRKRAIRSTGFILFPFTGTGAPKRYRANAKMLLSDV